MRATSILGVIVLMLTGCGDHQESSPVAPAPSKQAWESKAAKLEAAIKPGMTQDEVLAIAGEPTQHKTVMASDSRTIWDYEIAPRIYFRVFFNERGQVTSAVVHSQNKIGG